MYAVLIPLIKTESGDALLLEVRSEKIRQPGEVCFPGGRSECGETVAETAVRETCEELGLRPEDIEVISEFAPLIMGDGREIHPVKARLNIDGIEGLRLSMDEVSEVFLLPLGWLKENPPIHYDLACMSDEELPDKLLGYLSHYGSYRYHGETDWLEYKGHGIWGLTARILKEYEKTGQGEGRARAREILAELNIEDHPLNERFEFRDIRPEEMDRAAEIEQIVFPPNEAVYPDDVKKQAEIAPELFLVAVDRATGEIAGFLNGIATNETEFRDEFFTDKTLHDPDGMNVMLLGLDVLPEYRKQGLGRELMYTYCRREQAKGRKMLVLTCLPRLVKMYSKMGFRDNGISRSTWGGETWHEMSIILNI